MRIVVVGSALSAVTREQTQISQIKLSVRQTKNGGSELARRHELPKVNQSVARIYIEFDFSASAAPPPIAIGSDPSRERLWESRAWATQQRDSKSEGRVKFGAVLGVL